jgi:biotin-(acetyl-CoA carboxylase) ligase
MYQVNGQNFNGQIHGVKPNGKLIVETVGGQVLDFDFGEISFIL